MDNLKYSGRETASGKSDELLTVKFRYKKPDGDKSKLIENTLMAKKAREVEKAGTDFNFTAAVALFGLHLKDSEFARDKSIRKIIDLAETGRGKDEDGYRAEFIRLVRSKQ